MSYERNQVVYRRETVLSACSLWSLPIGMLFLSVLPLCFCMEKWFHITEAPLNESGVASRICQEGQS